MRQGNFEVFIKSEGRELPEYHMEPVDDKTLGCYVPSEVGKTFEICWRGDTSYDMYDTTVRCDVDGHKAGGSHCSRGLLNASRWGIREAADRRRPFVFSPLITTDDETFAAGPGAHPDLGTVEVQLIHAICITKTGFKTQANQFRPGVVHEKSKKMGVQCVSLGDGRRCKASNKVHVQQINRGEPYLRFVFRYRSKEFLQAEGIMPSNERTASDGQEQAPAGRKRRAAQLYAVLPEAGPSRKRARGSPSAAETSQKDIKPCVARNEDANASGYEFGSVEGRAQATGRTLHSTRRVKHEWRDPGANIIDLTEGEVKREGSPIRLEATGGVIDLTQDED
ncbi:hypothetical protein DAEQUDRAFT_763413 [Daedalea quercina L-15889]|uniref:DUF7918 domain-containing protein n=1 Tax=Daedalea quercina L-15889 TaxID=1314783 RepID=A0A165SFW2_9APHY|nr:hypothetical protein DAEQUDRAFT_763413 [Daedalea quercina L-15889]